MRCRGLARHPWERERAKRKRLARSLASPDPTVKDERGGVGRETTLEPLIGQSVTLVVDPLGRNAEADLSDLMARPAGQSGADDGQLANSVVSLPVPVHCVCVRRKHHGFLLT